MEQMHAEQLAALAHPQRLALFRLLMRRYPDRVPAGELVSSLGVRQNTLSAYLATLRQAGLIDQTRRGRSLLYRIEMAQTGGLMSYLFADCCRGRAELCSPLPAGAGPGAPGADGRFNVLFVCSGNATRSLLAESILRAEAGDRFAAHSAGTDPKAAPNPAVIEMLEAKGHDTAPLRPKALAPFRGEGAPAMHFVVTLCDKAANEDCPAWPGQPISAHWGMPAPAQAGGTEAERSLALQQAYGALRRRILAFTALPVETLDRAALQARADEIGGTEPALIEETAP
ncbi:metalloregulator ArsR/SmtB family transcription factor [Pseudoroseicyclus aestuarii]|uniref:ArsR family transcriptional regulator n=1 Tax=Pseudoroseicyclus aestuarii TaxID=1795041 RepID=A0A318SN16_9RHOB|nr:metalloregulator ArsR/SmtB family transcription factor [Pseudoroseicyclus aestuarii]PYE81353.1 ArsR family transcriptional regulator [Pseudoroseicyclus aestuarii]